MPANELSDTHVSHAFSPDGGSGEHSDIFEVLSMLIIMNRTRMFDEKNCHS
jgi:hypothetical protein